MIQSHILKKKVLVTFKLIISLLWKTGLGKLIFSLSFAFVLLIFNYKWSNKSITGNEEEKFVTDTGIFLNNFFGFNKTDEAELTDIVFINISNDKQLIQVYDDFGIPKGNLDITDREKIASFLNRANNSQEFILLDVIFDPIHRSKNDSLLYKSLVVTKNILVPSVFKKGELVEPFFDSIATGISAYKKSIYTNRFVKYRFIEKDTLKSIALKMSEVITNSGIYKEGMFYYDSGQLCLNSIILNHKIKPIAKYNENGVQNFYDLGVDILEQMSDKQIQNLIKDKIVLIGDFEDRDMHPTIYGKMQGVVINYNAYLSLKNRNHLIPKSLIFLLFLIYFLISIVILLKIDIKLSKKIKSRVRSLKLVKKVASFFLSFNLIKNTASFLKKGINHILTNYIKVSTLLAFLSVVFFLIYEMHIEFIAISGIITLFILVRDWTLKKENNEK